MEIYPQSFSIFQEYCDSLMEDWFYLLSVEFDSLEIWHRKLNNSYFFGLPFRGLISAECEL
jgi:hypothetical protein